MNWFRKHHSIRQAEAKVAHLLQRIEALETRHDLLHDRVSRLEAAKHRRSRTVLDGDEA